MAVARGPRALTLFEGACKAGDGFSCESLGGYYDKACKLGDREGCAAKAE